MKKLLYILLFVPLALFGQEEDIITQLNQSFDAWNISIHLQEGWNIIAYYLVQPTDAVAQFQQIEDKIIIVKSNDGSIYWPDFGFNNIGDLTPGQGYQVRVVEDVNLQFEYTDLKINLTPTFPDWVNDLPLHFDVERALVRVVNMLGQEVNPENQPSGTVLLYLYNDATVEKKIK